MSTPKYDALSWTVSCGCAGGNTKAVAQVKRGKSDGVLSKVMSDDTILVSEWLGGAIVRVAERMSPSQIVEII